MKMKEHALRVEALHKRQQRYNTWLANTPAALRTVTPCPYCGLSVAHDIDDPLDECPFCDGFHNDLGTMQGELPI